jgi:hypothetical protein
MKMYSLKELKPFQILYATTMCEYGVIVMEIDFRGIQFCTEAHFDDGNYFPGNPYFGTDENYENFEKYYFDFNNDSFFIEGHVLKKLIDNECKAEITLLSSQKDLLLERIYCDYKSLINDLENYEFYG